MSESKNLFEALASCIGPTPLPYVCRLYMDFLAIPSSILPSDSRMQIIKNTVNERFKSQFTTDQIRKLTNLIAMNMSFVRKVFLLDDLVYNSLTVNINNTMFDMAHDLMLLPFTTTCIYCQKNLTVYVAIHHHMYLLSKESHSL